MSLVATEGGGEKSASIVKSECSKGRSKSDTSKGEYSVLVMSILYSVCHSQSDSAASKGGD